MKRHITLLPATAVLLVLLLSACGGSSGGSSGGGSGGGSMDTGIGPEGGEVVSDDGQLTLTVPEGALADPTDIVITELTGDDIPDEFQDPSVRKVYDLQPDGLEFALPATVEVRTMGSPAPPDGAPVIGLVSESGGELELLGPLENTVDDTGIVASAPISHFSSLAVTRPSFLGNPESNGVTASLSVEPSEVPVGGSFTLRFAMWADSNSDLTGTLSFVRGSTETGDQIELQGDFEPPGFSIGGVFNEQHMTRTFTGTCVEVGSIRLSISVSGDSLTAFFATGGDFDESAWSSRLSVTVNCIEPSPPPPAVTLGIHPAPAGLTGLEALFLLPPGQGFANLVGEQLVIFSGAEGYAVSDLVTGEVQRSETSGSLFGAVPISEDPLGPDSRAGIFGFGPGQFNSFVESYNPDTGEFNQFVQLLPGGVTDAFPAGARATSGEIPYVQADGVHFVTLDGSDEVITDDDFGVLSSKIVSLYAETAGGPLLAVTRESGEGRLFFAPRDGATPMEIGPVGGDARRIRCSPPICGVTSFADNRVNIVLWDGLNQPSIIGDAPVGSGPVGLDVKPLDNGNFVIGSTGFIDHTAWLTQVAPDGTVLSNNSTPLDEACENPAHIALFEDMEGSKAVATCFSSDNFQVFEYSPMGNEIVFTTD